MHHTSLLTAGLVALATAPGALAAGLYPKSSPVIQVDTTNYDRLLAKSNYTSVVEFYAPWCGHCQNLKPAYEKAAKSLDGLAKVAAVNCDTEENKPLCGQFKIQGFPTLKILRPGKTKGKPVVEDYEGPRTAAGIVDAVQDRINNHVRKVTDENLDLFLEFPEMPKILLFTEKGTTSSLIKSIAIDYLAVAHVGQTRNNQKAVVDKFGIQEFPTLVLLPPNGADPIVYDGALKKGPIIEFISQVAEPNPDPAPISSSKKADKAEKREKKEKAPPAEEAEAESAPEEPKEPTPTPAAPEPAPPIPSIESSEKLQQECLNTKAHTCVLAFVPSGESASKETALTSLAELAHKHIQGGRHLFPFFAVSEEAGASVRSALGLDGEVELVVVNGRRGWFKQFKGELDAHPVEGWLDSVRMGEGQKKKFPAGIVVEAEAVKKEEEVVSEGSGEEDASSAGTSADAPEPETEAPAEEASEVPVEEDAQETVREHEEL